ncbi:C39 family peptidase [Candidatus Dependentiae bacterium]|nr:C39 family peptidase [Candidatus Dependentiae bacterium]
MKTVWNTMPYWLRLICWNMVLCIVTLSSAHAVVQPPLSCNFSKTFSKFFNDPLPQTAGQGADVKIWERTDTGPFNELILSWNAYRPKRGKMTIWVSVKHSDWSRWHRLAQWSPDHQQTFVNKLDRFVHTKHVLVEMQRNVLARGFRVKVTFEGGADHHSLKALFACASNMKLFNLARPSVNNPTVLVSGVPKQSQMVLKHPRFADLCSPTATSLIVNYFMKKEPGAQVNTNLHDYVIDFADKVLDKGYLDIYGNWLLNVAHAYHASKGNVFFRVERLNSFNDLYQYLQRKVPVAVSVRSLRGGATPYRNGHFMVVVGWNRATRSVICIDPAFPRTMNTLKSYKIWDFLKAWARSRNLSYIPLPKLSVLS